MTEASPAGFHSPPTHGQDVGVFGPAFSRIPFHFSVDTSVNVCHSVFGSIQEPRQNLSQGSRTLPQKENLANLGKSPRTTNCQAPPL